jgi:hypothetical protein
VLSGVFLWRHPANRDRVFTLLPGYDPHSVHDARDVAQKCQDDVYPEVLADAHLQKDPKWWQDNR